MSACAAAYLKNKSKRYEQKSTDASQARTKAAMLLLLKVSTSSHHIAKPLVVCSCHSSTEIFNSICQPLNKAVLAANCQINLIKAGQPIIICLKK